MKSPTFGTRLGNAITSLKGIFSSQFAGEQANVAADDGLIKAFVSNEFLYKPPYGYPRMVDIPTLRLLAKTPYVFSVIKTIQDQVASIEWDIVPKEKDEPDASIEVNDETKKEYDRKRSEVIERAKEVKRFFNNPNGNDESFEFLLRAMIRDVLEVDSGVWVKVFGLDGKMKQLFARDGGTFLKNPDIHGYMGGRDDYVFVPPRIRSFGEIVTNIEEQKRKTAGIKTVYDNYYANQAAYFQYGWTAMMPIPFGKRELVYVMANPRTDSVYGRSPIEILYDVILTLFYGSKYNLDFYTNNNMPEGLLSLIGANQEAINAFRQRMEKTFKVKDEFGNFRKVYHKIPLINVDSKFTPFQLPPKEMEILSQQQWFHKIVMACFGVTPSEMGFTEDSNKATELAQSRVFKRKAVKPLLRILEYAINMQIMPELDSTGDLEFRFIEYDLIEDLEKHKLYELQLKNGIKSVNEIRDEMGLDAVEGGDEYNIQKQQLYDEFGFGEEDFTTPKGEGQNAEEAASEIEEKAKYIRRTGRTEKKAVGTSQPIAPKENEKIKKKTIKTQLLNLIRRQESLILDEIEQIFKSDKLSEIKDFQTLWKRVIDKIPTLLRGEAVEDIFKKFIKSSYYKGGDAIAAKVNANFLPNESAVEFLKNYNFDLIKNMNEELQNKLSTTLQRAFMNDTPFDKIKAEVKKIFDSTETRAETIVRTEENRAENFGRIDAAKQSTLIKGKTVVIIDDEKTSPLCKRLMKKYGNKTIPLDSHFIDSTTKEKWLAPPFHVNCRTRLATPIIRDKG